MYGTHRILVYAMMLIYKAKKQQKHCNKQQNN